MINLGQPEAHQDPNHFPELKIEKAVPNMPPIRSAEDWEQLLYQIWVDSEKFAALIEQLPERRLWETFAEEKYSNYCRNIHGIIGHTHCHLGQSVLIKKLLQSEQE